MQLLFFGGDDKKQFYTCDGEKIACNNDNNSTQIWGHLGSEKTKYEVVAFNLNSAKLVKFPHSIEEYFPNLAAIALEDNLITRISNNDFSPHKSLEYISLSHNNITNLDSNLFDGLPLLRTIKFYDNKIKHVGHDIKLPNFYVDLLDNYCIKETALREEQIFMLKFTLLVKCPPELSQIETELESRENLLTHLRDENVLVEERVQSLELIDERVRQAFDDFHIVTTGGTELISQTTIAPVTGST